MGWLHRQLATRGRNYCSAGPRPLLLGVAVVTALLALGGGNVVFGIGFGVRAAPKQPLPFYHVVMVGKGIPCLYCHADAMKSSSAGIPSVEKCMGCHNYIGTDLPAVQKLSGYWRNQQPIPWVRVYRLPRFVYFTHEVHIAQGLSCERCHGDVAHMKVVTAAEKVNMGWCLNCHEKQPNAEQLKDCVVCHK
jgi:hypothetical protein